MKFDDSYTGGRVWDSQCIRSKQYNGNGEWTINYRYDSSCKTQQQQSDDKSYQIRYSVTKDHKRSSIKHRQEISSRIVSFKIDEKDQCVKGSASKTADGSGSVISQTIKKLVNLEDKLKDFFNKREDVGELEGDTCDQFLTASQEGSGNYNGKLKFKVPFKTEGWRVIVSLL